MTIVHVQVPLNMRVGQTFMVEHAGQRVQIQVPPGVMPGSNPFDTLDRAGRVVKQS